MAPSDVAAITGDAPVFVSPVTIAEMKFGAEVCGNADIRQRRLAGVAKLMGKAILPIDEVTGEIFGDLAAQLSKTGRDHTFRIQDLWLASQAVQQGLILLTHNGKDFQDIPGIKLRIVEMD